MSQSLDEIYKTYSPVLYKICLRYANCEAEAEDILHDSFIRIHERLPQYKGTGSFEGWLKRVVVSVALNKLRTNRFTPKHHDNFDDINESEIKNIDKEQLDENREKLLNAQLTHQEILECMQQLPIKARTVFNLYVFEKRKHKEIAKELEITASTSKTQLKRARFLLNKLLLKYSEMKIKDFKKLSIFAIFIRKDNYQFIDELVKKSISDASFSPPNLNMQSITNVGGTIRNTTTSSSINILSQVGVHIKANILTYSLSTLIVTSAAVGVISVNKEKTNHSDIIHQIELRTIEFDMTDMDSKIQAPPPAKIKFTRKKVNKMGNDTVTEYEIIKLVKKKN